MMCPQWFLARHVWKVPVLLPIRGDTPGVPECVAVSQDFLGPQQLCPDLASWGKVRKKRAVVGCESLGERGHLWILGNSVLPALTGALSAVTPPVSFTLRVWGSGWPPASLQSTLWCRARRASAQSLWCPWTTSGLRTAQPVAQIRFLGLQCSCTVVGIGWETLPCSWGTHVVLNWPFSLGVLQEQ